jgi:hypothetical protein
MRRLAALVFLLVAAPAVAQQAAPPPPAERWFAIAVVNGTQKHMGPFPSLEACEEGRLKEWNAAVGVLQRLYVEAGDRPRALERVDLSPELTQRIKANYSRMAAAALWRDQAICERK